MEYEDEGEDLEEDSEDFSSFHGPFDQGNDEGDEEADEDIEMQSRGVSSLRVGYVQRWRGGPRPYIGRGSDRDIGRVVVMEVEDRVVVMIIGCW